MKEEGFGLIITVETASRLLEIIACRKRSRSHIRCTAEKPPHEPSKFRKAKYNYVKSRYLNNSHGVDGTAEGLVNFTTSVPGSRRNFLTAKCSKPEAVLKDARETNVGLHKLNAGQRSSHERQWTRRGSDLIGRQKPSKTDISRATAGSGVAVGVLDGISGNVREKRWRLARDYGSCPTAVDATPRMPENHPQVADILVLKLSSLLAKAGVTLKI